MAEVETASGQRRRGLHKGGRALESEHMSPPLEMEVHGVWGHELLALQRAAG